MNNARKTILKEGGLIAVLVLCGKILGFIKQGTIAWAFGASAQTDIYFSADGFTSTIGQILCQSIAPTLLTTYILIKRKDEKKADALIVQNIIFFTVFCGVLMIIDILFAPWTCRLLGIAYDIEQNELLRNFLVCLSPVILLFAIIGVVQGYLNANHKIVPVKLDSFFHSVFVISFILLLKDKIGIKSLLFGFLAGYGFYTLFVLMIVKSNLKITVSYLLTNNGIKEEMRKFLPILLGTSIVDVGLLVDKIIASSLEIGSVSELNYGQIVSGDIVNGVFINSIGIALLTSFTESVSNGDGEEKIVKSLRDIIVIMTIIIGLITILYFVAGRDLVQILLERGMFSHDDTIIVARMAMYYSIGFVFIAYREILVKAHYAYQDMISPALNSAIGVITNVTFSLVFSKLFGVVGIALATSIAMMVVSIMSVVTLRKHIEQVVFDKNMCTEILKIFFSGVVTLGLMIFLKKCVIDYIELVWIRVIMAGIVTSLIYILLNIICNEEFISKIIKK